MAASEMTTEELEKQRQQQAQMAAEWQKQMKMQQMQSVIMSTDPATILKTMASYQGITLFCNNPMISINLLNTIYNDLFKGAIEDDVLKSIADALNRAIQYTNQRRMNFGFGMGMQQPMGMMGFGMMNPMMGMQMPGMGMGMNMMPGMGMMGGFGMPGMDAGQQNMMGMNMGCGMPMGMPGMGMGMNMMPGMGMGMGMPGMNNFGGTQGNSGAIW